MLLAALDLIFESIFNIIESSHQFDVVERLREISRYHSALISPEKDGFVYPFFEFVAASPEADLRESVGTRQRAAIKALAQIVEEGKSQGRILEDVDSEQVAWELVGVYWTEDIATLIGLRDFVADGRPARELERILSGISIKPLAMGSENGQTT